WVAELDVRVRVLRGKRMPFLAAGPVAAAETGIGEANCRPRPHDQPERKELDGRQPEELRRRERDAADSRRGRGRLHAASVDTPRKGSDRKVRALEQRIENGRVAVCAVERGRARAEKQRSI